MPQDTPPSPDKGSLAGKPQASGLGKFWQELRRRKVVRVAVVYAIIGWLVIQIAATTFPKLLIPGWAESLVVMCVILGFPISLVVAWAFELTPEGIKGDSGVGAGESFAPQKGNRLNYVTLGLVVLVLTFLIVDRYLFESEPVVVQSNNNTPPASGETARFTITLPDSYTIGRGRGLAVSPDGQNIVFGGYDGDDLEGLFRRQTDQLEVSTIMNSIGGRYPFFSPDGRRVAFWAAGVLNKLELAGGPVQPLTKLDRGLRGGDWGEDDMMVVGRAPGLAKISATSGELSLIATRDDERQYWYPQVLPKNRCDPLYIFVPRGGCR